MLKTFEKFQAMPSIRPLNAFRMVICFRVLILFALDLILNGSFMYWIIALNESSPRIVYPPNSLNETVSQQPIFAATSLSFNVWDTLTLSERENIYAIWSSLGWPSYFKFAFIYTASIAMCIFFLFGRFNDIRAFISLFFPTVLLVWSSQLNTLCQTVAIGNTIFNENYKSLNFFAKIIFLLAMILYGWKASKIYSKRRLSSFDTANFAQFWRMLIRVTFFIPIWSLLNISILERTIFRTRYLYLLTFCVEMTYICKIFRVSSLSVRQRTLQIYNDILNDGLQEYLTNFWHRLKIPLLFRIFFLVKLTFLVSIFATKVYTAKNTSVVGSVLDENVLSGGTISPTIFRLSTDFCRYLIVRSCETFVSLCAATTL
uniref:TRC8-like N-terminal domain-containing protein n=1 Tax=Romanomermis culicivorax TaxID=13658 RepID=A0A915JH63_ROMCU